MKKKVLMYVILTLFLLAFGYSSNAYAAVTSTCGQCHYNDQNTVATGDDIDIVADFNIPNVQIVDKLTTCKKCHYPSYHNTAVTSTLYGWFSNSDSPNASPATLHKVHSGNNSAATIYDCLRCHGAANCSACHKVIPHDKHSSTTNPAVGMSVVDGVKVSNQYITCATSKCHNQMPNVVRVRPDGKQLCLNCHQYDKAGHGDVGAIHTTSYLPDQPLPFDCSQCHKNTLNSEHESRLDANQQPYNCATCHKSTRVDVKAAIKNNNKNCNACHRIHENITTVHTMSTFDSKCQTCHNNILNEEHLTNDKTTGGKNYTCNTCHVNNRNEVNRTIAARQVHCTGCHQEGHNFQFADQVPQDIPLYSGFRWTQPLEAAIFSNEKGAPDNYDKGQLVISNRKTGVSVSQVYNYYKEQLTNLGWKINGTDPGAGASILSMEYTKESRFLTIKYFNTSNSTGSGTPLEAGYKFELWYK